MTPEQIQALAALPLQALLLIAIISLWKAYVQAQNARIDDLKGNYERNLADLRTRVMLLEDKTGIVHINNAAHSDENGLSKGFGDRSG